MSGFADLQDFQLEHHQWVEKTLDARDSVRDDRWSEAIAVGSLSFVETIKSHLGIKATHREVIEAGGTYVLREPSEASTGKNEALSAENTLFWDETVENAGT